MQVILLVVQSVTMMQSCILPLNQSMAFVAYSDYNVALYSASHL